DMANDATKTLAPLQLRASKPRTGNTSASRDAGASRRTSNRSPAAAASSAGARASATRGMTGNQYRDLIAGYIHHNYAAQGLDVYVEISLGKTVIGKDRYIDVFVVRR